MYTATARRSESGDAANVWPLLAEHHADQRLADWLDNRTSEVERGAGGLLSIAIFVDGEDRIDPLVSLLQPRLEERNIRIVPCRDGLTVGDRQEVRVFDVQHVKGLEFKGVFFVGASRAATCLGVTCEAALPVGLGQVRGHFGQTG